MGSSPGGRLMKSRHVGNGSKFTRVRQASGTVKANEAQVACRRDENRSPPVDLLLVTQRFDRVKSRCPNCRIQTKSDADSRANNQTGKCPPERKDQVNQIGRASCRERVERRVNERAA